MSIKIDIDSPKSAYIPEAAVFSLLIIALSIKCAESTSARPTLFAKDSELIG